tara:strand:+ start:176 stop:364 length:189 start_codon:yes stop_codon:yes gene_type:complete
MKKLLAIVVLGYFYRITWWIAVRCKADNILYKSRYEKVIEGIPNRLKYFDEQNYDTYPLVCK